MINFINKIQRGKWESIDEIFTNIKKFISSLRINHEIWIRKNDLIEVNISFRDHKQLIEILKFFETNSLNVIK